MRPVQCCTHTPSISTHKLLIGLKIELLHMSMWACTDQLQHMQKGMMISSGLLVHG